MLRTILGRAPVALTRQVKLSRRTDVGKAPEARRRQPPRDGRDAELQIRTCSIVLPRPRKLATIHCKRHSQSSWSRSTRENHPPAPSRWSGCCSRHCVPTSSTTRSLRSSTRIGRGGPSRKYFKALESGCNYEKRQLESRHTLLNALGILPSAAGLALTDPFARSPTTPTSANAVLDAVEIHVLRKLSRDIKLDDRPTAAQAFYAIARLGGHFPQNGRPGWKVLWTGLQKLLDRVEGYRLAREEM